MFLRNPRLLFKSSSFKLITIYTILFVLSSIGINFYIYSVISDYIYLESREEIGEDMADLAEIYEDEGIEKFRKEVFEDPEDPFLVRLAGRGSVADILRVPKDWDDFEEGDLPAAPASEWVFIREGEDDAYEVSSATLEDGSVLTMGQTIAEREELLERIRNLYLFAIIPVIIIAYLGGLFVADRALNPIKQLINTLNSIVTKAKIDTRVPVRNEDRLNDELIALFNTMLDKIEALMNGMRSVLDNVAHDLRTPIARLRGTAEMALGNGKDPDALREALSDCIEESERILIMLNTLMDVSEAETGAMKLNLEEINVAPVIDDVIDLYGYVAEEKGVSVHAGFPEDLYLTADRSRIRQVLANLLDNAIKYTPSGGRIDIEARNGEKEVEITVKDTGVGISEDELDNIWDRLYRGDKSRSERGLGLGLSLVKAIVGAHRGRVEVSSKPGLGSVFSVRLPA